MNKLTAVLAGLGLLASVPAMAEGEDAHVKVEHDKDHARIEKKSVKHTRDGDVTDRHESKVERNHKLMGGTETVRTDTDEHDAPHARNHKVTRKESIERDANGNIIKHTVEKK